MIRRMLVAQDAELIGSYTDSRLARSEVAIAVTQSRGWMDAEPGEYGKQKKVTVVEDDGVNGNRHVTTGRCGALGDSVRCVEQMLRASAVTQTCASILLRSMTMNEQVTTNDL